MYEAIFRVGDGGEAAYAAATAGTDARVELWCTDQADLLCVRPGQGAAAEAVLGHVAGLVGVREQVRTEEELVVVTDACLRSDATTVETYLASNDCLLVPPLRYADGAKQCRVLGLSAAALANCYRELVTDGYTVNVIEKHEVTTPSGERPPLLAVDALPSLTDRQREVFRTAYVGGYYDLPRGITMTEVAAEVGIERRTAEEHRRRAEKKLVEGVIPYLLELRAPPTDSAR